MKKPLRLACALIVCCVAALGASTPASSHIVVVALENHSYADVVGSPAMPYLNSLINQYGLAANYYADVHGSFPDYDMLTTGEFVTLDGWGTNCPITVDNLAREIASAGKTWKSYAESIPSTGYTGGDSYPYVKDHNPFAYFSDVLNNSTQAANIVPFTQFGIDVSGGTLPSFSFVIPNLEHDAHDCPDGSSNCTDATKLTTTDQWLQANIAPLLTSPQFQQDGLLIIWWDEGNGADSVNGGGRVAQVFAGPRIKTGYQSTTFYRHENLLRTIVEALSLRAYPGYSQFVPSMSDFFGATTTTGSVSGTVTNAMTSAVISGATINYSGGSGVTDSNGNYSLPSVPAGVVSLTASANGYQNASSSVSVNGGQNSIQNFALAAMSSGCVVSTVNRTVTICSPGANATISSPVNIVAKTTDNSPVTLMQIYIDGIKRYEISAANVNTSLALTTGVHRLTVQAYDTAGNFKSTIYITVQ